MTTATASGDITQTRPTMNIVMVGHVDHGKSTLVGRLFYDTKCIPESKYEAVARVCEDTGKPFEFAFLLDALEEERDQGITIDTTHARFHTEAREYVLIDAPGHKEFLKNMITGAASAEAAILLIDAAEGVQEQSRRHGFLLHLLGIRQVTVAVNKMDMVGYSEEVFNKVKNEFIAFLHELGVEPRYVIPISAREGDYVASPGNNMPWYGGKTILEALDSFDTRPSHAHLPLRLPVQDVYKFDHRRIVAGRIESGTLNTGDEVIFSPSGHKCFIKSIERWNAPERDTASAGESIGVTLSDQIFVERGEIMSHIKDAPKSSPEIFVNIFWLGDKHFTIGRTYTLKLATQEIQFNIKSVISVMDSVTLNALPHATEIAKNEVAKVCLTLKKPVAFDIFSEVVETGRLVIVDEYDAAGGGIVLAHEEMSFDI